jgi:hypothetical protein
MKIRMRRRLAGSGLAWRVRSRRLCRQRPCLEEPRASLCFGRRRRRRAVRRGAVRRGPNWSTASALSSERHPRIHRVTLSLSKGRVTRRPCFDKLMLRQAHASTSSCFDKLMLRQAQHDTWDASQDDAAFSSGSVWPLGAMKNRPGFIPVDRRDSYATC